MPFKDFGLFCVVFVRKDSLDSLKPTEVDGKEGTVS
jgi:hypothetical protein